MPLQHSCTVNLLPRTVYTDVRPQRSAKSSFVVKTASVVWHWYLAQTVVRGGEVATSCLTLLCGPSKSSLVYGVYPTASPSEQNTNCCCCHRRSPVLFAARKTFFDRLSLRPCDHTSENVQKLCPCSPEAPPRPIHTYLHPSILMTSHLVGDISVICTYAHRYTAVEARQTSVSLFL